MAEEVKGTGTEGQQGTEGTQNQQTQQSTQQQTTETQKQGAEQKVDVEKVKSEALSGFLKDLGVEDADALKGIVTKHKEKGRRKNGQEQYRQKLATNKTTTCSKSEKGSAAQLANVCDASSGNYFGFNLLLCTDGWFGYGISKL